MVVKKVHHHIEEEEWLVTLSVLQLHSFFRTFGISNRNRRLRVTDLYVPPHSCGVKSQKDLRGGRPKTLRATAGQSMQSSFLHGGGLLLGDAIAAGLIEGAAASRGTTEVGATG